MKRAFGPMRPMAALTYCFKILKKKQNNNNFYKRYEEGRRLNVAYGRPHILL